MTKQKIKIGKEYLLCKKPLKVGDLWAHWGGSGYSLVEVLNIDNITAHSPYVGVRNPKTREEHIVNIYDLHEVV